MDLRDNNNAGSSNDTSQLLFLSLFLLLSAFFIHLNSLSTIEDARSREVLSSVAAVFRVTVAPNADSPIVITDFGPVAEPERLLAALQQLWVMSVRLQDVRPLAPGRAMEMIMPANELFLGDRATLRQDRQLVFQRLAACSIQWATVLTFTAIRSLFRVDRAKRMPGVCPCIGPTPLRAS